MMNDFSICYQSPRFKSFGSGRIFLNPALIFNIRLNSDDNLCHVIDSGEIDSHYGVKPNIIKPTSVGFSGE